MLAATVGMSFHSVMSHGLRLFPDAPSFAIYHVTDPLDQDWLRSGDSLARSLDADRVWEIGTGHDMMVTEP